MPDPRGGWWRQYFVFHPLTETRDPTALAGSPTSGKYKCICTSCFEPEIQQRMEQDTTEYLSGQRARVHSRQQIVDDSAYLLLFLVINYTVAHEILYLVWAEPMTLRSRVWVASHVHTVTNHLISCKRVSADIRHRAKVEKANSATGGAQSDVTFGPPHLQTHAVHDPNILASGLLLQPHSTVAGPSRLSPLINVPIPPVSGPPTPIVPDTPLLTAPWPQASHQLANFSPNLSLNPSRSASPLVLPPSLSSSASPTLTSLNSRRRSLRAVSRAGSLDWTSEMQHAFEQSITRVTVSANLPLNWVTDPELSTFKERYLHPAAQLPSAKLMTTKLIPAALRMYRQSARS